MATDLKLMKIEAAVKEDLDSLKYYEMNLILQLLKD